MDTNDRDQPSGDRSTEEQKLRIAIGKRLGQLRKRRHWTQAELALRLGVTRIKLVRWERGVLPPVHMLILLSEVLDTTLDALLAGRSTPKDAALTMDQKKKAVLHLNQLAGLLQLRHRETPD
jgi:transcriptional regulator with XRE-family HTH domain